jgi:response regulator of citrate/malate metabolism
VSVRQLTFVVELGKVPVLMMSAYSRNQTLRESVPLGVVGYIVELPQISALKLELEHGLTFRR